MHKLETEINYNFYFITRKEKLTKNYFKLYGNRFVGHITENGKLKNAVIYCEICYYVFTF